MKKEIYSCDRCGCELETDGFNTRNYRQFAIEEQTRRRIHFYGSWMTGSPILITYDLCEKCRDSLEEWLSGKDA